MLTRSRERKPREHESHVSSRQVRKEMVYQKGCFQVRARVPGVLAHFRVRHLSQCGALEAPVATAVRAWGYDHRVGGMDRDVDKPGEASNRP